MIAVVFAVCQWMQAAAPAPLPTFQHVVIISVDGLRPECVMPELEEAYPGLARLARGPHTLQGRCDPETSITLPNHCSLVTGRLASGAAGHGWIKNSDPPSRLQGGTLDANHGGYVSSVFDVAHDHGARTALVAGKLKLVLFEQSYGADAAEPDSVAPDNGRNKLDVFVCDTEPASQLDSVMATLRRAASCNQQSLTFWHIPSPDFQGHATGWDLSNGSLYRKAVQKVDMALQQLFHELDHDSRLKGRVSIVLTADHGGGAPHISHTDPLAPLNFTIPFMVWLGADSPSCDLYEMNADCRTKPLAAERFKADATPPIRNADCPNVALALMGLPPIAGSTANAKQELQIVAPTTASVSSTRQQSQSSDTKP